MGRELATQACSRAPRGVVGPPPTGLELAALRAHQHPRRPWQPGLCDTPTVSRQARTPFQAPDRTPFAPHQFRHAHAVELAREGVPLPVVQRQLGRSYLSSTSVYLQGSAARRSPVGERPRLLLPQTKAVRHNLWAVDPAAQMHQRRRDCCWSIEGAADGWSASRQPERLAWHRVGASELPLLGHTKGAHAPSPRSIARAPNANNRSAAFNSPNRASPERAATRARQPGCPSPA